MKIKVGLFTVAHPEIDAQLIRGRSATNVILWETTVMAVSDAQAILKALLVAPVDEIEAEVKRRWPRSRFVDVTSQRVTHKVTNEWMRSFRQVDLDGEVRRLQRGEFTPGETVVLRRL